MKKSTLAASILSIIGTSAIPTANAAVIGSFRITGGTFALGFFTPGGPITFDYTSGADLAAGYVAPTWNVNASTGFCLPGAVLCYNFGGPSVNYYTGAVAEGTQGELPRWVGGPVVNGTFGSGGITVDLSSLFANFKITEYNQGNIAVTGTTTGGTSFSIDWTSPYIGGPFNGQVGTYTATGTLTAIPIPAAAWLMGSGMVWLAGAARRRKAI